MNHGIRPRLSFLFCLALIVSVSGVSAFGQKSRRAKVKEAEEPQTVDEPIAESQVQLKLNDGTRITVEDAWESEQGIWYRQGGMTHLVSRERVKGIVRGTEAKPKVEAQVASVTDVAQTPRQDRGSSLDSS